MDRALSALATSSPEAGMKEAIAMIEEGVRNGLSLSAAILQAFIAPTTGRRAQRSFAASGQVGEFAAMVEAGEASGDLPEVLLRYAELLDRRLAFRRRLRGALFYPLIVAGIAFAVVIFIFVYVLPTITKLFEGSHVPLPLPTQLLFTIASVVDSAFLPVLVLLGIAALLGRNYLRTEAFRLDMERRVRSIPWIGELLERAAIARWSASFATLLRNGVDILAALDLAARASQSLRIRKAIEAARPKVAEGVPLAKALRETGVFPAIALESIEIGEASGALAALISDMAAAWEAEVESSAERMADLLEPFVLVIMGVIVGGIVLAVLLPIFEINSRLK